MTLSESAINEIMFALENGNGSDLVHQLAQLGIHELIDAEATEVIGADKWERTVDRIAKTASPASPCAKHAATPWLWRIDGVSSLNKPVPTELTVMVEPAMFRSESYFFTQIGERLLGPAG